MPSVSARASARLSVRALALCLLSSVPFGLAACSTDKPSTPAAGDCPVAAVNVVVSVDQWGDIVSELGGACATVTTVLASSSVDPHDYEPSPADAAAFQGAQLVVVNGGHYDEWAAKLAAGSAPNAPVIRAIGDGQGDDANPHVWYDPTTVSGVADAVTAELNQLAPAAADYFTARRNAFGDSLKPYTAAIAAIRSGATGKTYAATESVFDLMASALGLQNRTPPGYQAAASHESEPSPADLNDFIKLLDGKGVDVLIFNTQTEGSVPAQLRSTAEAAGVPVVEVTETVAPDAKTFEAWQVAQLTSLAKALGVNT